MKFWVYLMPKKYHIWFWPIYLYQATSSIHFSTELFHCVSFSSSPLTCKWSLKIRAAAQCHTFIKCVPYSRQFGGIPPRAIGPFTHLQSIVAFHKEGNTNYRDCAWWCATFSPALSVKSCSECTFIYVLICISIFRHILPVCYTCLILSIWLTTCDSDLVVKRMATRRQCLGCILILFSWFSSSLFRGDCTQPIVCVVWASNECNFYYCCYNVAK